MSKFVTQDGIERLIGIVKSELDGKSGTGHTHEELVEHPNLFDKTSSENQIDKTLSSSGGIKDATGAIVTHYIPVEEGEQYFINYDPWFNPYIFLYDSSKTLVQMIKDAKNEVGYKVLTIPSGVSYIVTEMESDWIDELVVKKYNLKTHEENKDLYVSSGEKVAYYSKIDLANMRGYIWGGENAQNQIQASEDLNNFTTFGIYFSDGSPITSTLLNCPASDKAGRLEVICLGTTGEVVQKWIRKDGAIEWTRAYINNEWTTWNKIIKQTDLDIRAPWQSVSVLTQAEYDAITTPLSTTLYLIKEA